MYMYENTKPAFTTGTGKWMFTKLGRDEVLMARHMQDVLAIFAQG